MGILAKTTTLLIVETLTCNNGRFFYTILDSTVLVIEYIVELTSTIPNMGYMDKCHPWESKIKRFIESFQLRELWNKPDSFSTLFNIYNQQYLIYFKKYGSKQIYPLTTFHVYIY